MAGMKSENEKTLVLNAARLVFANEKAWTNTVENNSKMAD